MGIPIDMMYDVAIVFGVMTLCVGLIVYVESRGKDYE